MSSISIEDKKKAVRSFYSFDTRGLDGVNDYEVSQLYDMALSLDPSMTHHIYHTYSNEPFGEFKKSIKDRIKILKGSSLIQLSEQIAGAYFLTIIRNKTIAERRSKEKVIQHSAAEQDLNLEDNLNSIY